MKEDPYEFTPDEYIELDNDHPVRVLANYANQILNTVSRHGTLGCQEHWDNSKEAYKLIDEWYKKNGTS